MPDISEGIGVVSATTPASTLESPGFHHTRYPKGVRVMAKAAKPAAKKPGGKKTLTKSQFVAHLAEKAGITKKQVDGILTEIIEVVKTQVGPKGAGKFVF